MPSKRAKKVVDKLLDVDAPERYVAELPPFHQERWCFTEEELKYPQTCHGTDELVAHVYLQQLLGFPEIDENIIVLRNGTVTDRYEDRRDPVSPEMQDLADAEEDLWHPVTHEWVSEWRDVFVDKDGNFVNWK
jgi:hypothetical protein